MNSANLNSRITNGNFRPDTNGTVSPNKSSLLLHEDRGTALPRTYGSSSYASDTNGASTNGALPETNGVPVPEPTEDSPNLPVELHRISEVRIQQGASLRSVSRKMDLTVQEVREQENSTADLRITELLKWQEILDVPLADLLIDSEGPLSEPVCERARMLRIMKTAKAIHEGAHNRSIVRLANMLIDQLVEIMPELSDVSAWHTVGQRRTQDEVGRIVERSIPDNFFTDSNG